MSGKAPNAFALLLSSSQQDGSARKRAKTGGGSGGQATQREPCPVCQMSVPKAFLEQHVTGCLDRRAASQAPPPTAGRRRSTAAASSLPGAVLSASQGTPSTSTSPPAEATPQALAEGGEAGRQAVGATPAASTAATPRGGGTSAFEVLLASQREQQQQHVFYLERRQGGDWHWHWWQKGVGRPPPGLLRPVWSASTQLKQPARDPLAVTSANVRPAPPSSSGGDAAGGAAAGPPRSGGGGGGSAGGLGKAAVTLSLQTNVPPGDGAAVAWGVSLLASNQPEGPHEGRWRGGASVMKSALQKCVRLGRAEEAVRISLALVKDAPEEFLRRISIICLEDVVMHPALPLLVWATAAQAKGYVLGGTLVNACLAVVWQLASVRLRDFETPGPSCPAAVPSFAAADEQLPASDAALVKALLLRAAFGGMACDVAMLKTYAAQWAARFRGQAGPPPAAAEPAAAAAAAPSAAAQEAGGAPAPSSGWLSFLQGAYAGTPPCPATCGQVTVVGPLRRSDIPLGAVDFHVSDVASHLLQHPAVAAALERLTTASWGPEADAGALLQRAMWLFRSSTNPRPWLQLQKAPSQADSLERHELVTQLERDEAQKQRLEPLWRAAAPVADAYATAFIKQRFAAAAGAGPLAAAFSAPPRA